MNKKEAIIGLIALVSVLILGNTFFNEQHAIL